MEKKTPVSVSQSGIFVTSVVVLSSMQMENIRKLLPSSTPKNLPIVNKIDKRLLGGFTVSVNDWFLDASLIYQLETLKDSLINK